MKHPTLYKMSSTGKVLEWYMESQDDRYRAITGQQDGKKIVNEWTICTPKNVGRANEMTPVEQCQAEVESAYTYKLHQGQYHKDPKNIGTPVFHEPMLAMTLWFPDRDKDKPSNAIKDSELDYDSGLVFDQPKYDGFRCLMKFDGPWTRKGKTITTVPHIVDSLVPVFQAFGEDFKLDGELYVDKDLCDFDEISSILRKKKPTPDQRKLAEKYVRFYLYDLPENLGGYEKRYADLVDLFNKFPEINQTCVLTPTVQLKNEAHRAEQEAKHLDAGLEGQIIKLGGRPYEWKRTKQILKRKVWIEEEFKIVRVEEGVGKLAGKAARIVIDRQGVEVRPGLKFPHDRCLEIWQNRDSYIGGDATVKYQNVTPDGSLRFCKVKTIFPGKRDI